MQDEGKDDKATDRADKKAARANNRQAARAKKLEARAAGGAERPTMLCSLRTMEVKKSGDGIQLILNVSDGRRSIHLATGEVAAVMRDLETAIHVIRGQQ